MATNRLLTNSASLRGWFSPTLVLCLSLFICGGTTLAGQRGKDLHKRIDYGFYSDFAARVAQYVELQQELEKKLPKLSSKSTPEEVDAHRTALAEMTRTSRADAKLGDIFEPEAQKQIRKMIAEELKGPDAPRLRATIMDEDTSGVPLRLNQPYPDEQAVSLVPPTILLKLPLLPDPIKYRFVRRHLVLLDEKANLIIDYMANVVP